MRLHVGRAPPVRDGKPEVGEFAARALVEVLRLDILRVDDVRDVVFPERLQRRRCADVPDEERATAGDPEDWRDILVEVARPRLIAQPGREGRGRGRRARERRAEGRSGQFRNATKASVTLVYASVVSDARALSSRARRESNERASDDTGVPMFQSVLECREKISLEVSGAAVAGGDIVKSGVRQGAGA